MKGNIVILLLLFFTVFHSKANGQCLCADMTFQIVLPNLKIKKNKPNYKLSIQKYPYDKSLIWKAPFFKKPTKGDTITFSFATGGGIDCLVFSIIDPRTAEEMTITVTNMYYDNPYFIDLGSFTKGRFRFDWDKIDSCQREQPSAHKIICNGQAFYQLKPKELEMTFIQNSIKPLNIYLFQDF